MLSIVFIVFLILKLSGLVDWSWWLVFMPLFIEVSLMLLSHIFSDNEISG